MNPHKTRRETVKAERGKERGKAVGDKPASKHDGAKNIGGTVTRQSY
jgi:hypothetical protein